MTKEKKIENEDLVDKKYKWYLYDLGPIIKDYLKDHIKESKKYKKGTSERSFIDGQLMSFVWFIGMLQQQADAFNIGREELRLDDIDPEKDI